MGAIAFTALAQGLLTDRYLERSAADIDRATARPTFDDDLVTDEVTERLRGLAGDRRAPGPVAGPTRTGLGASRPDRGLDPVGASSVAQLDENLGALSNLDFTPDELAEIDQYASDSGIDLWRESSDV